MKELIDQVVARAGISAEQAQGSIAAVIEFLKGKLPGPLASQLDKFVGGEEGGGDEGESSNPLDAAKDALGGFFGKKD
jgi:hypothetical protein